MWEGSCLCFKKWTHFEFSILKSVNESKLCFCSISLILQRKDEHSVYLLWCELKSCFLSLPKDSVPFILNLLIRGSKVRANLTSERVHSQSYQVICGSHSSTRACFRTQKQIQEGDRYISLHWNTHTNLQDVPLVNILPFKQSISISYDDIWTTYLDNLTGFFSAAVSKAINWCYILLGEYHILEETFY